MCSKLEEFKEGRSTACVAISEGQVARVDSFLIPFTNVEVTHEETNPIRVRRKAGSRRPKPLAKFLQGAFELVVKVDDRTVAIHLPSPYEVITSWEIFFVLDRSLGCPSESK